MATVLGLNAHHGDAAACLVSDGVLLAAVEEERFRRRKSWSGFPALAAAWCLGTAGLRAADLDIVAVNRAPRLHLGRRVLFAARHLPAPGLLLARFRERRHHGGMADELTAAFRAAVPVQPVEHHRAHLASGFLVSPFERAVIVSLDGSGDFVSAAWGMGEDSRITIDGRVFFPHSLGLFYEAITRFLGFPAYGDEYKLMGLAAYGAPRYAVALRRLMRLRPDGAFRLDLRYFRHHRETLGYAARPDGAPPVLGNLFSPALEMLLGAARRSDEALDERHADIARSAQLVFEEALFHLLRALHARYRCDALVLSGGCALNAAANGKIAAETPFRGIYVPPAAGDAGGALGAAFTAWHAQTDKPRRFVLDHAAWGPEFDCDAIRSALDARRGTLGDEGCRSGEIPDAAALVDAVAQALADGRIVAWFQGRLEWGPRALGSRSILADPRRRSMRERLNAAVKLRESFRPFAPSVLSECASDWFEVTGPLPFMTAAVPVRPARRRLIPAVTHVDCTARVQTVSRATHPLFHSLIARFRDLTGVPMLLNTSFNENEPIVCTPAEAIDCFLRTGIDVLSIGPFVVERTTAQLPTEAAPILAL